MRILVVSNLYPPDYVGGYELACREAVEALQIRGHEIKVLTRKHERVEMDVNKGIYRRLEQNPRCNSIVALLQKELINQINFMRMANCFHPHVLFYWNPTLISLSLVIAARRKHLPVCFYVFDDWLANWSEQADPWFDLWSRKPQRWPAKVAKNLVKDALRACGVVVSAEGLYDCHFDFASHYLEQNALLAGKPLVKTSVIHWGIDMGRFPVKNAALDNPRRLLFIGQVLPHKGVHTAIEAIKILREEYGWDQLKLDIVGGSSDAEYYRQLRDSVTAWNLEEQVKFAGFTPRECLSSLYRDHDALLFPSSWNEPFGMVLLEAMASGLPVVGTATGGSAEILQPEINSLIFARDNPQDCAIQVLRLITDKQLFERLRQGAHNTITARFSFANTMDNIELSLLKVARSAS